MSLNIKNPQAHEMAKELAHLTGQSMTEAVITALEAQLRRRRAEMDTKKHATRRDIDALVQKFQAIPVINSGPLEDALYDENGLPKDQKDIG